MNKCYYCYGHGLMAGMWDLGYRRVMERGTKGDMHPAFRSIAAYACDRCGLPKKLKPAPDTGGPHNRTRIEIENQHKNRDL